MTTQSLPSPGSARRRTPLSSGRWAPLPVVLAGTFMVVLDFFIVNVALPSMGSSLSAGQGSVEWVVAGYALSTAIFLVTAGRLGDRYGRRRIFSVGLALFTLASAACGAAATPAQLVAARIVQGIGAALLTPNVLSIIGVAYSGPDRERAIGIYATVMGLAAVGGQLIGGGLIAANVAGLGWRSCFLINVPIGAAALVAAPRLVPESRQAAASRPDVRGTLLAAAGLTALLLPLVQGRQAGWPAWTWVSLAAAPALLGIMLSDQRRRSGRPGGVLIDLALFEHRTFRRGVLTQLCFWAGQASFFVVLALYLQEGRGLSPLAAGLVFTVLALSYLAASTLAPGLRLRHGRAVIWGGALVLAAGHGLLLVAVIAIGTGGSWIALVPGLLLVGAGMGLVLAPLAATSLESLEPERAGAASGMMSAVQYVGTSLGVAVTGAIFFGALPGGYPHALELALGQLALLLLGVAVLGRRLPAAGPAAVAEPAPVSVAATGAVQA